MQKYYVYCRYEYISSEGKEFSKWFRNSSSFDTKELAENELKKIKSTSKEIDKSLLNGL